MSFLNKFSALNPFFKKEEILENYFALNIESENLTVSLWTIDKKELKVLDVVSEKYKGVEEIVGVSDKLLDAVLGIKTVEPQKILFGVPDSWLHEENLKEEYLKLLRKLVKEFELTPMAYVATSHALVHFLEKKEEVPTTAIVIGIEENHITTTVVRAGKLDGTKVLERRDDLGVDIEKALLNFTSVETLPSKILLYGKDKEKLSKEKIELLSFPWMSKLSFLHLPKIEILEENLAISSVCLAGGSELVGDVIFKYTAPVETKKGIGKIQPEHEIVLEESMEKKSGKDDKDFGFRVGDVSERIEEEKASLIEDDIAMDSEDISLVEDSNVVAPHKQTSSVEGIEKKFKFPIASFTPSIKKLIPKSSATNVLIFGGIILIIASFLGIYLFLPKAGVHVYVEPRILEKDTQVTADPKQKDIDEVNKIIPAQIVESEVSGTDKESATGKKQVGDPAKDIIIIYNKTDDSKTFSKGIEISSSNVKFSLDTSVTIASQSATRGGVNYGNSKVGVSATSIGADGNIPSGIELTIANFSKSQFSAESEGNFSGGTSKDVTVISDADQKRLLAKLTSSLKLQAQQKLQEKLPEKKVLQEALSEEIVKKSFNKNINDQANEVSLNLTAKYTGTAFEEKDLKAFVAKLVTTDIPSGFDLKLDDTETQSDISKLEKGGKLIFLARFKAKLIPRLDKNEIKKKIKGKTPKQAKEILKKMENILDVEIMFSPNLPTFLQRLPLLDKNIQVEVGLK